MKKINVGFIGAGAFISSTHLKTAGEADFINIAAIHTDILSFKLYGIIPRKDIKARKFFLFLAMFSAIIGEESR